MRQTDVLVIGCGIAGCVAALELAKKGLRVLLLSAGEQPSESNSYLAQGGIVYQAEGESPEEIAQDILRAGAGLCSPAAVEQLVKMGPDYVQELLMETVGVPFDRLADGTLSFTQEGGHARPRILHYKDQSGKAIVDALLAKLAAYPQVELLTGQTAVDLITLSHHSKRITDIYEPPTCVGAYVLDHRTSCVNIVLAKETILATGGLGEVFLHSTNPPSARGDGLAMAYRAGARIMNMEYIQFHPTSLYVPNERRFLLSEALRGEGAELLDIKGRSFMHDYDSRGSLAPRDIVARGIYAEMLKSSSDHVWLDISSRDANWLRERFPTIYKHCLERGIDITHEPVPVVPAAHYSCGGIAVDLVGQTALHRLRAIGEVACTGVHGANRLASTSLLEAVVWGKSCADDASQHVCENEFYFPPVDDWIMSDEETDQALIQQDWISIKHTMWNYVGLVRDERRLHRALKMLQELRWEIDSFYARAKLTKELIGLRNGILTAHLITQGAVRNKHSLGCHFRSAGPMTAVPAVPLENLIARMARLF